MARIPGIGNRLSGALECSGVAVFWLHGQISSWECWPISNIKKLVGYRQPDATEYIFMEITQYKLRDSRCHRCITSLIARFMRPTWGPPGADRTQVGPMLAPWTLLSGMAYIVQGIGDIHFTKSLWAQNSNLLEMIDALSLTTMVRLVWTFAHAIWNDVRSFINKND